eukprot:GHVH01009394.1.p1 GENE.GHVH01009394.1~~GHVH01009394.1.p1  ORF type:complete len:602 (-),score=57.98 GHVH01009394.1:1864-3669(-)
MLFEIDDSDLIDAQVALLKYIDDDIMDATEIVIKEDPSLLSYPSTHQLNWCLLLSPNSPLFDLIAAFGHQKPSQELNRLLPSLQNPGETSNGLVAVRSAYLLRSRSLQVPTTALVESKCHCTATGPQKINKLTIIQPLGVLPWHASSQVQSIPVNNVCPICNRTDNWFQLSSDALHEAVEIAFLLEDGKLIITTCSPLTARRLQLKRDELYHLIIVGKDWTIPKSLTGHSNPLRRHVNILLGAVRCLPAPIKVSFDNEVPKMADNVVGVSLGSVVYHLLILARDMVENKSDMIEILILITAVASSLGGALNNKLFVIRDTSSGYEPKHLNPSLPIVCHQMLPPAIVSDQENAIRLIRSAQSTLAAVRFPKGSLDRQTTDLWMYLTKHLSTSNTHHHPVVVILPNQEETCRKRLALIDHIIKFAHSSWLPTTRVADLSLPTTIRRTNRTTGMATKSPVALKLTAIERDYLYGKHREPTPLRVCELDTDKPLTSIAKGYSALIRAKFNQEIVEGEVAFDNCASVVSQFLSHSSVNSSDEGLSHYSEEIRHLMNASMDTLEDINGTNSTKHSSLIRLWQPFDSKLGNTRDSEYSNIAASFNFND